MNWVAIDAVSLSSVQFDRASGAVTWLRFDRRRFSVESASDVVQDLPPTYQVTSLLPTYLIASYRPPYCASEYLRPVRCLRDSIRAALQPSCPLIPLSALQRSLLWLIVLSADRRWYIWNLLVRWVCPLSASQRRDSGDLFRLIANCLATSSSPGCFLQLF